MSARIYHSPVPFKKFVQSDTDTDAGTFTGLASTFGGEPDYYGDIIEPGAFTKTLADHAAHGSTPAMFWSHDMTAPIGRWLRLKETDAGLEVTGKLTLDVAKAREARALMQDGALGLSIGFTIADGGFEVRNGARHLSQIDLMEISAVALPANRNARISGVKAVADANPREFERAARDALGLSRNEAKRLMSGGWSALVRDEPDVSEVLAAIAAEIKTMNQQLRNHHEY